MKKIFGLTVLSLAVLSAMGQSVTVTFTGRNPDGDYHSFTSVHVQNQTRGWEQTLVYPDTTLVLHLSQGIADVDKPVGGLSAVMPNPLSGNASATLSLSEGEAVVVELVRVNGQRLATKEFDLPAGCHHIAVSLNEPQVAFLSVKTSSQRWVTKLINKGNGSGNSIAVVASSEYVGRPKSDAVGDYQPGDVMTYVGYCSGIESEPVTMAQQEGELIELAFPNAFDENGASYGVFTVKSGENGKSIGQVRFSRGNLQYTMEGTHAVATGGTEVGTWRFAENQWDIVGPGVDSANGHPSETFEGWIDLFAWGTSGWEGSGADCYQPWSICRDSISVNANVDEGWLYTHYSVSDEHYEYDLTGDFANADWGVYNAISNGGDQPGMWRTLSSDEWNTILFTRAASTVCGQDSARWMYAKVEDHYGLILFPDVYVHPEGAATLEYINNYDGTLHPQEISMSDWRQMEEAGCILLTYTGERLYGYGAWHWWPVIAETNPDYIIWGCNYWTTTRELNGRAYEIGLYGIRRSTSNKRMVGYCRSRMEGHAVRVVQNVGASDGE